VSVFNAQQGAAAWEMVAQHQGKDVYKRILGSSVYHAAVNLAALLDDTCSELLASLQYDGRLEFPRTEADTCALRADKANLVMLIVREAATNAIKYAHPTGIPGRITVACSHDPEGAIAIEVVDDRVGLPEGLNPETDGDTGFRVKRALSQRLKATSAFKVDEPGTGCGLAISARCR
jgi:two-component sensor histidine kinase